MRSILEGALEKYFFPWSFRLPYPDRTYHGRCSDDGHLTACVGQLRTRLYQKTTRDFYHFTTPPGRPSNTRARCSHLGYYGCSFGPSSNLTVSWYVPRIDISASMMSSCLRGYCYPTLTGRVTSNDRTIDMLFKGDEIDPRSAIPDVER